MRMERFKYIARDGMGRVHKGIIEAEAFQEAINTLRARRLYPIDIRKKRKTGFLPEKLLGTDRVPNREIALFCRELSTLINSGIPLATSLRALEEQMKNRALRKVIASVKELVETGHALSDAVSKHPGVFSEFFISMIRSGEETGKLDQVLDRYASFVEKREEIKAEVKNALTYPVILTFMSLGIVIFLVTFVLPKFMSVIQESGVSVPLPTLILVKMSHFMIAHYQFVLLGILLLAIGLRRYLKTSRGRDLTDKVKLKLPLLGEIFHKLAISRLARTMSTLLSSGVPFLKNLELAKGVVGNSSIAKELDRMKSYIAQGESIAGQLKSSPFFPPMVVQMISIGEKTGKLDQMLGKIADFYDQEVAHSVKRLTNALEPILIIGMALVVGFIAISLIMTIMKALKTLS